MDGLGQIDRFHIKAVLARSAISTVYEAWDAHLGRKVAIKTVSLPEFGDDELEEKLSRFKREAQAAGRLQHPNIVAVYDYGETAELAYIVMEYIDGTTLKTLLERQQRFELRDVLRIMSDVLVGLQYIHQCGIVHRDIKPGNIMLTADGRAKITDFGIARIESSSITQVGSVMGTPAYMSPEQFQGETVDRRTDIYSLGVVLYQMLAGRRPYEGGLTTIMHKVLTTEPPPPSQIRPQSSRSLDAVVARAMAKRREARFPDAKAFHLALAEAAELALISPAAPEHAVPKLERIRATRKRPLPRVFGNAVAALSAGAGLLLALGGVALWLTRPGDGPVVSVPPSSPAPLRADQANQPNMEAQSSPGAALPNASPSFPPSSLALATPPSAPAESAPSTTTQTQAEPAPSPPERDATHERAASATPAPPPSAAPTKSPSGDIGLEPPTGREPADAALLAQLRGGGADTTKRLAPDPSTGTVDRVLEQLRAANRPEEPPSIRTNQRCDVSALTPMSGGGTSADLHVVNEGSGCVIQLWRPSKRAARDQLSVAESPQHGSVHVHGSKATYAPEPGFAGTDSFSLSTSRSGSFAFAVTVVPPQTPAAAAASSARRGASSIGLSVGPVSREQGERLGMGGAAGVLVLRVDANSPAESAQFRPNDVILNVNGTHIDNPGDLSRVLAGIPPGDPVRVEIWRDGAWAALNLTPSETQAAQSPENTSE